MLREELLTRFAEAAAAGNADVFVGAGLSRAAGYPDWDALLEPLRIRASIPTSIRDLPLVAEYFGQRDPGGRSALEALLADRMAAVNASPSQSHRALDRLSVDTFWTTNYDQLVESSVSNARVVIRDEDLVRRSTTGRRVVKLHGSLRGSSWDELPVITRGDYESYQATHPRMWAALQASYMTRAILFLGFSFNDPNIEILLRLARSTLRLEKPEHYTILRRPSQGQEVMEHMLRVTDLQRSGVGVVEIEDYGEHEDLLTDLVRRTRPPRLFITGSGTAARDVHQICGAVAHALAALKLQAHSLSGLAARLIKITLGERLIKESGYDPSSLVFHYRRTESGQAPVIDRRIGTVVFWDERDKDLLRRDLIGECRLLLVIGGGAGTAAETSIARQLDIPIVPMPRSGGVAEVEYNKGRPAWVRSQRDWALLNDDDAVVAASAAARLIAEGMHLDGLLRL